MGESGRQRPEPSDAPGRSDGSGQSDGTPARLARLLLRRARHATLATQSDGQPFAGLVTPAIASDASLLLLLSDLSEHTRHLRADPRCAVMAVGPAPDTNPQTAPRVTLLGLAAIDDSAALRARYLAVHPYAALYADFGDFHLWRVGPIGASYVGGFARAWRVTGDDFAPDPESVEILGAAATDIVAHCNEEHADTMALLFDQSFGAANHDASDESVEAAVMVGVDVDGCDIRRGEIVRHVAWSRPAGSADAVRRELILLARAARGTIRGAAAGR